MRRHEDLYPLNDFDGADMALPDFQLSHVWNRDQARGLLDSLCRWHPVAGLLAWATDSGTAMHRSARPLAAVAQAPSTGEVPREVVAEALISAAEKRDGFVLTLWRAGVTDEGNAVQPDSRPESRPESLEQRGKTRLEALRARKGPR